ncbi:MAG: hypothetical protein R2729_31805 [Bryobacteraceae bacterium]
MEERDLEVISAACGALFIIMFTGLMLFHDQLLPGVEAPVTVTGSTILMVAGLVLMVVGVLHRSARD